MFPAYPWTTLSEPTDDHLKITLPNGTDLRLFGKTQYKIAKVANGKAHTATKEVPCDVWQALADWVSHISWA